MKDQYPTDAEWAEDFVGSRERARKLDDEYLQSQGLPIHGVGIMIYDAQGKTFNPNQFRIRGNSFTNMDYGVVTDGRGATAFGTNRFENVGEALLGVNDSDIAGVEHRGTWELPPESRDFRRKRERAQKRVAKQKRKQQRRKKK